MQALHLSKADYNFARRSLTMSRSHHVRGTASQKFLPLSKLQSEYAREIRCATD